MKSLACHPHPHQGMATLLREEVLRQSRYDSDRHNSTGPRGKELFFKTKGKSSLESELMDKTEHNDLLLLSGKLGSLRILHSL